MGMIFFFVVLMLLKNKSFIVRKPVYFLQMVALINRMNTTATDNTIQTTSKHNKDN